MVFAAAAKAASSSPDRPVVPTTIAQPWPLAVLACPTLAAGLVKSITTSAPARLSGLSEISTPFIPVPARRPLSWPIASASARSVAATSSRSGAAAISRMSMRPIRPAAPGIPILICGDVIGAALLAECGETIKPALAGQGEIGTGASRDQPSSAIIRRRRSRSGVPASGNCRFPGWCRQPRQTA